MISNKCYAFFYLSVPLLIFFAGSAPGCTKLIKAVASKEEEAHSYTHPIIADTNFAGGQNGRK
jgi:hypothetical protein